MAKRILVPVDGSEQSTHALEYVVREFPDATVVALHVIDPARATYGAQAGIPTSSEEWFEAEEDAAAEMFEEARELAGESTVELETEVEIGQPSRAIVEYAEEGRVDQIVMGSHGRQGVARVLLGSVAETVVRRSPIPVTVVR